MSRNSHHPSDRSVRLVMGDWRLRLVGWLTLVVVAFSSTLWSRAQEAPVLSLDPQWENGEVRLGLVAPAGVYRVESSDTLSGWDALVTLKGTGSNLVTAVAPPDRTARFYRVVAESDPKALTGDHFRTSDGDLVIHPVNHASFVLRWREILGGRRMYMSGDTGNIPEMRALPGIDVAFVCMNVPFTMTLPDAITAVRAFRPAVVYPYHFRNQNGALADLAAFQRGVSSDPGIEVRRRVWY